MNSRVILPICCKLQCWSKNSLFKHSDGRSSACDTAISHATVLSHSKFSLSSDHHYCSDWVDRLQCCISVVEAWQAWVFGLLVLFLWCLIYLCANGSRHFCNLLFLVLFSYFSLMLHLVRNILHAGYIIHQTKKLKQQLWPLELHDMVRGLHTRKSCIYTCFVWLVIIIKKSGITSIRWFYGFWKEFDTFPMISGWSFSIQDSPACYQA